MWSWVEKKKKKNLTGVFLMQFQVQLTHKTLKKTGTELLPLRILVTKQKQALVSVVCSFIELKML